MCARDEGGWNGKIQIELNTPVIHTFCLMQLIEQLQYLHLQLLQFQSKVDGSFQLHFWSTFLVAVQECGLPAKTESYKQQLVYLLNVTWQSSTVPLKKTHNSFWYHLHHLKQ